MTLRKQLRKISVLKTIYRASRGFFQSLGDRLLKTYYNVFNIPFVESCFARVHNFGDLFSRDLLNHLGYKLIHTADYKKSHLALTGSILQMYHQDYSGYIMGSGFIHERFDRSNNQWKIKIIRGPLSKKQSGCKHDCLYGDPGIMASVIYPKVNKKTYRLGILPHCVDYDFVKTLQFGDNVKIISARQSAAHVARDIQQCEYIASSSLHGLIFADAFSIPNIHLRFGDKLIGGNHKFQDYYLGMDSQHEIIYYRNQLADEIINHCKTRFSGNYILKKQSDILDLYKQVLKKL